MCKVIVNVQDINEQVLQHQENLEAEDMNEIFPVPANELSNAKHDSIPYSIARQNEMENKQTIIRKDQIDHFEEHILYDLDTNEKIEAIDETMPQDKNDFENCEEVISELLHKDHSETK